MRDALEFVGIGFPFTIERGEFLPAAVPIRHPIAAMGVETERVCEITYLTWSGDGLLRQTVFFGLREDKPAKDVRREKPE